jgi:hypothetical protein
MIPNARRNVIVLEYMIDKQILIGFYVSMGFISIVMVNHPKIKVDPLIKVL